MLCARSRRVLLLSLVVGASLVAGCHSASSTPPRYGNGAASAARLYSAARTATASASSVRYVGHVQLGGKAVDFDLVAAGQFGGGTITIDGATLNIVRWDASLYLRTVAAGWRQLGASAGAAQLAAGKWILVAPPDTDFGPIASLTNVSKLVEEISIDETPTKARKMTWDGRSAIALTAPGEGSVLVATTGEPYILEVRSTRAGDLGTITFSSYNSASSPAAPAHSYTISSLRTSS